MTLRIPRMICILTIASLAVVGGFATSSSSVMAQEATSAIGDGPSSAAAPLAGWVTLENGTTHWYAFTEGGGEKDVEVRMALSQEDSVDFEVWTSDNLREWQNGSEFDPVGAGTANENLGDDLYWTGNFISGDEYYVVVKSRNYGEVDYQLTISGQDVGFPSVAATVEETTEAAATEEVVTENEEVAEVEAMEVEVAESAVEESATEESAVEESATEESAAEEDMADGNDSAVEDSATGAHAGVALAPNGEMQLLAPGEKHWYKFREEGDGATVQAVLSASPKVGIYFEVWTAEQFGKWQRGEEFDPVGAGTENTEANIDLSWQGDFNSSSNYYVIVRHTGLIDGAVEYRLSVTGDDVSY